MTEEKEVVYDVDYFIDKFKAIDEYLWITQAYFESIMETDDTGGYFRIYTGRCCAEGFCYDIINGNESEELRPLISLFLEHRLGVISVNDGNEILFQQSTPKQRILAALNYIKTGKIPSEQETMFK